MASKLDRSTLITLGVLLLIGLAGASVWGYGRWRDHQQATLRELCAQASKDKAWDQLESHATAWLQMDEKNSDAWLYLGEAAQAKGDFERAAECLGALDEADPKCLLALLELVEMQLGKLNRPLEAMETCRRIRRIDPHVTRAHQRMTFFYAMTLQRREMIRTIRTSIDLHAAEPEAFVYLLLASALRFSNGYEINTHWLKSDPDNEHFQVARAIFLARGATASDTASDANAASTNAASNGLSRAEALIQQCRERFPHNAEILAYLLDAAVNAGNIDDVARLLASAPDTAELDGRFWRFKGWYHSTVGELDDAEKSYRESLRWDPYDWRSRHQLATVLRLQNKLDEVESLTELALIGKQIEQEVLVLPSVSDIPVEMASRIADLSEQIGDLQVANGIRSTLARQH